MTKLLSEEEVRQICFDHLGDNQRARAIQLAFLDKLRSDPAVPYSRIVKYQLKTFYLFELPTREELETE